jgi:GAF domain-containing protein
MRSDSLPAKENAALLKVCRTVNSHLELDGVLESLLSVTKDVMEVEASSLFLIDESTGDLVFHVVEGEKADKIKTIRMKRQEGIVGDVIRARTAVIVNRVDTDPRFCRKVDDASGFVTRSILCVPVATPTKLWGAIEVLNRRDGTDFTEENRTLCEAVAGQAAIAIENAMLHKQIVERERLAAIGRTIAGMAHCIKNVLNGLLAGSSMLELPSPRMPAA